MIASRKSLSSGVVVARSLPMKFVLESFTIVVKQTYHVIGAIAQTDLDLSSHFWNNNKTHQFNHLRKIVVGV